MVARHVSSQQRYRFFAFAVRLAVCTKTHRPGCHGPSWKGLLVAIWVLPDAEVARWMGMSVNVVRVNWKTLGGERPTATEEADNAVDRIWKCGYSCGDW